RRTATGSRSPGAARSSRSRARRSAPRARHGPWRAPRRALRRRPRARAAARRRGWCRPALVSWLNALRAARRAAALLLAGRDAAHDELRHVGLHVAVEELLLGFLGEYLGVVEGHVARELDDVLRHEVAALAV